MIAYVLEYDWVLTRAGWRLHSGSHESVREDFQFRETDARFLHANLSPASYPAMKSFLDQNGLRPRVLNVLSSGDWSDAYCVLRFEPHQGREAVLAQLFCS